jgi:Protein of unknown function (DUF2514)
MIALLIRFWWAPVILALCALIGVQQLRIDHAKTQLAQFKQEASDAARVAADNARTESERRQKVFDDEAAAARVEKANLEADISRLANTADGLRDDLAAFKERAKHNPKAPLGSKGQPGPDPIDLLSILYARADREAAELAGYADRLRLAGSRCEQASDKIASP